jgi:limonene-1,2-epoxide hydrolase
VGAFEVRDGRIHAWRDSLDLQVAERIRSDEDPLGWLVALL